MYVCLLLVSHCATAAAAAVAGLCIAGDVLTAMLADLSADNNEKISQLNLQALGALMMSLTKISSAQASIQWPLMQVTST